MQLNWIFRSTVTAGKCLLGLLLAFVATSRYCQEKRFAAGKYVVLKTWFPGDSVESCVRENPDPEAATVWLIQSHLHRETDESYPSTTSYKPASSPGNNVDIGQTCKPRFSSSSADMFVFFLQYLLHIATTTCFVSGEDHGYCYSVGFGHPVFCPFQIGPMWMLFWGFLNKQTRIIYVAEGTKESSSKIKLPMSHRRQNTAHYSVRTR